MMALKSQLDIVWLGQSQASHNYCGESGSRETRLRRLGPESRDSTKEQGWSQPQGHDRGALVFRVLEN